MLIKAKVTLYPTIDEHWNSEKQEYEHKINFVNWNTSEYSNYIPEYRENGITVEVELELENGIEYAKAKIEQIDRQLESIKGEYSERVLSLENEKSRLLALDYKEPEFF